MSEVTAAEELELAYRSQDSDRILRAERKIAGVRAEQRGMPAPHRCICPICRAEIKR